MHLKRDRICDPNKGKKDYPISLLVPHEPSPTFSASHIEMNCFTFLKINHFFPLQSCKRVCLRFAAWVYELKENIQQPKVSSSNMWYPRHNSLSFMPMFVNLLSAPGRAEECWTKNKTFLTIWSKEQLSPLPICLRRVNISTSASKPYSMDSIWL